MSDIPRARLILQIGPRRPKILTFAGITPSAKPCGTSIAKNRNSSVEHDRRSGHRSTGDTASANCAAHGTRPARNRRASLGTEYRPRLRSHQRQAKGHLMSNKAPPQPHEPRPNVRAIIGPNPTAGLVEVFGQIDEYRRKERKRFAQQLAAIGRADSDGQQATQGTTAQERHHATATATCAEPMTESPREIASRMPHRRALGEKAVDPAAESELGRMRLRGEVSEPEATAGEVYARMWRGYVATLGQPARCRGWPWARVGLRRLPGAADRASSAFATCASGFTPRRRGCWSQPVVVLRRWCMRWSFSTGNAGLRTLRR